VALNLLSIVEIEMMEASMMRLQLRTPKDMRIEDIILELAHSISKVFKEELYSEGLPIENLRAMQGRIVAAFCPYVRTFDKCASEPICTKGCHPEPEFDDRIYILELPHGIDSLVDDICAHVLEPLDSSLGEAAEFLNCRVNEVLLQKLDKFLYRNPACGHDEICSSSLPLNPWNVRTTS
jgi:hypothetical protein